MGGTFIFNLFKTLILTGVLVFVFGFIWLIALYFLADKEVMQNRAEHTTTLGNALLVMHSIFEPGKRPQTEQVIWVRRRRTPVEKGVLGLEELNYDKLSIKGYIPLKGKSYRRKSGV
ncbi:MAG: hypothetical protein GX383_04375 [Clostridium sp.]|jgi:hypothetical protein|nr:hypothetical protein [Clostridium sp.]